MTVLLAKDQCRAFLDSHNERNDCTWREWFADVLIQLGHVGDTFSGKRPGHNDSDWWWLFAEALCKADLIPHTSEYDEVWEETTYQSESADELAAWDQIVKTMCGVR